MSRATPRKLGPAARARRKARIAAALAAVIVIGVFVSAYIAGIFKPIDYTWQSLEFIQRHDEGADPPISVTQNIGSSTWLNQCSKAGSQASALKAASVHSAADANTLISACQNPLLLVAWDSLSAQDIPEGFTRELTARLIDRLSAAGARLIILDRLYEDDRPGTDQLVAAMRKAGNVVIAQELTDLSKSSALAAVSGLQLVPLNPKIAAAARAIGLVNVPPPDTSDPRHLYRTYNNLVKYSELAKPIPSLSLAAAKVLGIAASNSDPTFSVNFAGVAANTFVTESLGNVLGLGPCGPATFTKATCGGDNALPVITNPSEIAGRIVFVGDEVFTDNDHFTTPVDVAGPMYGVEFHMHAFNTILHKDPLNVPSLPFQVLVGFPFACLAAAWAERAGLASTLGVMLAMLVGLLGTSFLLFTKFDMLVDSSSAIAALIIAPLVVLGVRFGAEQRAQREIRSIFGRYVAPKVVSRICEDPDSFELEGSLRDITVLFSDIRGFTTLSEGMSPQQIVQILNRYFTAMVEEIHAQGGTVDKYVGDAIMALFGAPDDLADAPACAVRAAIGMQRRLTILNEQFDREYGHTLAAGVGLHHGSAAVGIMGCPSKREYSAIGDTVNTASRLESYTKDAGYGIVASANVVSALPADLTEAVKPHDLGNVAVKGRTATVRVYGLGAPIVHAKE